MNQPHADPPDPTPTRANGCPTWPTAGCTATRSRAACARLARRRRTPRSTWHAYHLIGDVLRSDDLARPPARDAAFLAALRAAPGRRAGGAGAGAAPRRRRAHRSGCCRWRRRPASWPWPACWSCCSQAGARGRRRRRRRRLAAGRPPPLARGRAASTAVGRAARARPRCCATPASTTTCARTARRWSARRRRCRAAACAAVDFDTCRAALMSAPHRCPALDALRAAPRHRAAAAGPVACIARPGAPAPRRRSTPPAWLRAHQRPRPASSNYRGTHGLQRRRRRVQLARRALPAPATRSTSASRRWTATSTASTATTTTVHTVWPQQARGGRRAARAPRPAWCRRGGGSSRARWTHYDAAPTGQQRGRRPAQAQVLLLEPRDDLRFAQRLWADEATGLLLRADVLDGRRPGARVVGLHARSRSAVRPTRRRCWQA